MKKITLLTLAAGLIAFAPALLRADDNATKPADKPSREELREKLKDMTPEQKKEYFKNHRNELGGFRGAGGPGGFGNADDIRKHREETVKKLGLDPEEIKNSRRRNVRRR